MTDVMVSLLVDVHSSKAKQTSFDDGNCFVIASTVSVYSLQQMWLRVVADGSTRSLLNASYDRRSLGFDTARQGISADTNSNMM